MKVKAIMKQFLMLVTILIMTLSASCSEQNNTNNQKSDTIKVEVKIINMFPIGWGVKYMATIEKIVEGSLQDFDDTITFGIIASNEYDNINVGDSYLIALKNTKEISKTTYLPSITGTVSKRNEIWLITKINRATEVSKRRTFVGTSIMSNDKAMFIWDFADSEAFYLDGLNTWDEKHLNKQITVEGVLIQFIDGKSLIKDWKIIEAK
jgi:hypothetical protein